MKAFVIDTTLRDGEQAPGVVFSPTDKMHIAEYLNELGVHEVEAGMPAIGNEERKAIETIAKAGFNFRTSCWCRANIEDLKQALPLGTQSVNISLPVSDIQIQNIGKDKLWIMDNLKSIVSWAVDHFQYVTVGAQDASRANLQFLREYVYYATEFGASRVRITDTVGVFDPMDTKKLISDLAWNFPSTEFEFHGHNDFGMATANAITAIKSGATCVSGTVNGLGERAGNSVLEEVIAYLATKGNQIGFNTNIISELSEFVAKLAGHRLADNKALTGEKTFKHESGIHTSAMIKNKETYQVIDPGLFGNYSEGVVFGKHSGSAAIKSFFEKRDIILNPKDIELLLNAVKSFAQVTKQAVTEDFLLGFYKHMTGVRDM